MIKLDLSQVVKFEQHKQGGWKYAMDALRPLHSKSGLLVDTFIEWTFACVVNQYYKEKNRYNIPYTRPWIGFSHNPPNGPIWFDRPNNIKSVLNRDIFKESLKCCKCLVVLSDYLRNWLQNKVDVPVISVKYPTDLAVKKWDTKFFQRQKYIPLIQVGYWLRDIDLIKDINTNHRYTKIWIPSSAHYSKELIHLFSKVKPDYYEKEYRWSGVSTVSDFSSTDYHAVMSSGIVCMKLYDASANTTIIECIAKHTPIIINKIDAVVEYLGENYPLYFEDENDIPLMLQDTKLIFQANKYLKAMDKSNLSRNFFLNDLYKKLENIL